jgi:hypothetical protein
MVIPAKCACIWRPRAVAYECRTINLRVLFERNWRSALAPIDGYACGECTLSAAGADGVAVSA